MANSDFPHRQSYINLTPRILFGKKKKMTSVRDRGKGKGNLHKINSFFCWLGPTKHVFVLNTAQIFTIKSQEIEKKLGVENSTIHTNVKRY